MKRLEHNLALDCLDSTSGNIPLYQYTRKYDNLLSSNRAHKRKVSDAAPVCSASGSIAWDYTVESIESAEEGMDCVEEEL